jgi:hypothetical protein
MSGPKEPRASELFKCRSHTNRKPFNDLSLSFLNGTRKGVQGGSGKAATSHSSNRAAIFAARKDAQDARKVFHIQF